MLDASCAYSSSQKILQEENLSDLYPFCRKSTLFSINWINTSKSRCSCFNIPFQGFGWWRPQSQPTSPAEGKIRSFQCKLVVFITLILWTHLPAWDDLSGWQDKPVGSSVTQLSGKCKPICFQFGITGFDKYSGIIDIDANMKAAWLGIYTFGHKWKTWSLKRPCTSHQRLQQQGLKLGMQYCKIFWCSFLWIILLFTPRFWLT